MSEVAPPPAPLTSPPTTRRPAERTGRLWRNTALACLPFLALVMAGPLLLDEYSVSILIRSLLYGSVAVTVDILWGFAGVLSFG